MLTFPPHCSHRLQPHDVAVYGPMKSAYKRALHDHQMAHPGQRIDLYQMADIFRRAYDGSFTRKNILKGFEASGVSPLNRDVFDETDFAPAAVSVPVVVPSADQPAAAVTEPESPAVAELELEPTAATVAVPEPGEPAGAGLRSPESIRPLPRLQVSVRKVGGKRKEKIVQSGENTYEDVTMRCNTANLPEICSNQAAGRTCSSQKLHEFFLRTEHRRLIL